MKIGIPDGLIGRLPALYTQQHLPDPIVFLRFFFPAQDGCQWYVFEGEDLYPGDFMFFGLIVEDGKQERQFFTRNELEHVTGSEELVKEYREAGIGEPRVICDPTFTPMSLSEVRRIYLSPKQEETPDPP